MPAFFGDELHAAIGELYACVADPALFPAALDNAARLCGAKGMLIGPLLPQAELAPEVIAYASEVFHEAVPQYLSDFIAVNPRRNWLVNNRIRDEVFCDDAFFSRDQIRSDPFYNEFLLRNGNLYSCDRVAGGVVNGVVLWISAQYASDADIPDQGRRETFKLLSGHIAQAIAISHRLDQNKLKEISFDALVDAYSCAALIIDRNATIVALNDRARSLDGRGLSFGGGQLAASAPNDGAALVQLLRDALTPPKLSAASGFLRLTSPAGEATILLRASLLPSGNRRSPALFAIERPSHLLIVAEVLEKAIERSVERPLLLLGLTQAEARIAAMIGQGNSPTEAAERHNINVSTVRVHLRSVYDKLAINRQGELVRIVARLEGLSRDRR